MEEEILKYWKDNAVFEKSLEKDAPNGEFTFYDGPPFANGLPHSGSLLSSVAKDLIPRYKTMRGYRVRRRWGWDTHGLPIESAVEKQLGLKNKKDILSLGVQKFNETAKGLVLEYVHEWKKYIERIGRWVDFDNAYTTMDPTFMESVWWGLKQIHEKGHLYEGRKVLMYCPHCETPLAKAEIAMDNTYKDVTEEAVTVQFKIKDSEQTQKLGLPENTFILAWTTTPWTLPGNVALAVGKEIQYGLYERKVENEIQYVIVAKELAERNSLESLEKEFLGAELVGIAYEPLYEIAKVAACKNAEGNEAKKWEVVSADFVTAEDGTGIVHTAVIYGEDDYALGLKEGLPMVPLLSPNGTYNSDAPEFLQGKYFKKAEAEIKEDLESRGQLFSREQYKHSYPHCYRCGTALIYNAVSSWFINIQAVKERMLAANEDIAWIPEHLKHGRFQHNLETAPDWTISRNRFWATPLPIWKDDSGNVTVIGSLEELKAHTKKSGNTYFLMRHGTTEDNVKEILSSITEDSLGLTEQGKNDVLESAKVLAGKEIKRRITKIYVSPLRRAQESAQIVCEEIGMPFEQIHTDNQLTEFNFGEFERRPIQDLREFRSTHAYDERLPGGESYLDAKLRFASFLYDLERTHTNETILILSHGIAFESLLAATRGLDAKASKELIPLTNPARGSFIELPFVPLPHNSDYELDYHLPYIDQIQLIDANGNSLTRIPEVVDCWVESGSMPFAEYHYPFENKEQFEKRSPGDFVSEYIGQTRAWFYYMHAMSVQLFDRAAFRNVITTGTILAADGEKVSKSKKNYTDPFVLLERFSADAFRYYLMSSVLMQAEDLAFKDDEVKEIQNRVVNMLRNVLAFYKLFKDEIVEFKGETPQSPNVLDAWILSRLAEVIHTAEKSFDAYDVPRAVRPMRGFIDDLSTWYVRRSRDRVKGDDAEDKQFALHTLRHVLTEFSKCIAPVMPFIAEEIYQATKDSQSNSFESVHLCDWPSAGEIDTKLNDEMQRLRAVASEALMLRQKSGIKVRQPLAKLFIQETLSPELAAILADEINVKEIVGGGAHGTEEMSLDTELTPELIREGDVREFMRALADARKEKGLTQKDVVGLKVGTAAEMVLREAKLPGISGIAFVSPSEIPTDAYSVTFSTGAVPFALVTEGATSSKTEGATFRKTEAATLRSHLEDTLKNSDAS
jgi:isoleucyl-tRNA synthetase